MKLSILFDCSILLFFDLVFRDCLFYDLHIFIYISIFLRSLLNLKFILRKKKTKGHFSVVRRSVEFSLPISSGTEDKYRGKN
jgi:hypothetical protein